MPEPMRSRRRIEHLKQLAYDCNLTNDQAREFGKLTATATWEKLLLTHGLEFDRKPTSLTSTTIPAVNESPHQINLLEWVDLGQAFALAIASVGFALLILGLWPKINPLNLFPSVKIQIQIGQK